MPYYLVPLTEVDIERRAGIKMKFPLGWDTAASRAGRNWIKLQSDAVLLWLANAHASVSSYQIAEDADERLALATRQRLTTLSDDRQYRATASIRDTVTDLLRNAPVGRWGSLRPSKVRRRYEIWLGPGGPGRNLWHSEPAQIGPSTKTYVDNFNRSAANLSGSTSSDGLFTWAEPDGTDWTGVNNRAECSTNASFCVARADADCDTVDMYVQADLAVFNRVIASALGVGIILRITNASPTTVGYGFESYYDGGGFGDFIRIYDQSDDATLDGGAFGFDPHIETGLMYLEADGSSLTAKVDGVTVLGPVTDTTHSTQKRAGITTYASGVANTGGVDNFECGDLSAGFDASTFEHLQQMTATKRRKVYLSY